MFPYFFILVCIFASISKIIEDKNKPSIKPKRYRDNYDFIFFTDHSWWDS